MAKLVKDTFNRADQNPLNGVDWLSNTENDLQLISNEVRVTSDSARSIRVANPSHSNDQWVRVVVGSFSGTPNVSYAGIALRSDLAKTYYELFIGTAGSADQQCYVQRVIAGSATAITSPALETVTSGDEIYASVIEDALVIKKNGVTVNSGTDSNIVAGRPGPWLYVSNSGVLALGLTDFESGDFLAPDPTSISPNSGDVNTTIEVTVTGTSFDIDGATLSFNGTGITVDSYVSRNATTIVANITIASGAALGLRDVIVTNPSDDQVGTLTDGFEVTTAEVVAVGSPDYVFTPDVDWSQPFRERTEYLTDILTSYDQTEQRIQLRDTPRTIVSYRILQTNKRDTAEVASLLWKYQSARTGVPFWPDAQPLLADAVITDTNIELDTTFRRFTAGAFVLIWRDMRVNEFVQIATVNVDSLDLAVPLTMDWDADGQTLVIPLLIGWLEESQILGSPTNFLSEATVTFECETPTLGDGEEGEGPGPYDVGVVHECPPIVIIMPTDFTRTDVGGIGSFEEIPCGTGVYGRMHLTHTGILNSTISGQFTGFTLPGEVDPATVVQVFALIKASYMGGMAMDPDDEYGIVPTPDCSVATFANIRAPYAAAELSAPGEGGDPATFDFGAVTFDFHITSSLSGTIDKITEVACALVVVYGDTSGLPNDWAEDVIHCF